VAEDDIMVSYTPFGHSDWQSIVAGIKRFGSTGRKTAVVSTVNGDANVPFYKELANQGVSAADIPVVAFSVGEEELSGIDTAPLVGHLAAWNYFMSVEADANYDFIDAWLAWIGDDYRVTNDPMEAHYIGFNMWAEAVRRAGTTDPTAVQESIIGVTVPNLSGGVARMLPNHHITKPVLIGEILDDGQFQVVYRTREPVPGDAWSDYLPGSRDLIADWTAPRRCGNYSIAEDRCLASQSD
jgi:urea transport system substrate-binding protein